MRHYPIVAVAVALAVVAAIMSAPGSSRAQPPSARRTGLAATWATPSAAGRPATRPAPGAAAPGTAPGTAHGAPASGQATGPARAGAATAAYSISRCGNTSRRVLLTFDDWSYRNPRHILDYGRYLHAHHIGAEFFLIGSYARRYPAIVRQLRAWGFWVGNHSYSHPDLARLSSAAVRYQVRNGVRSTYLRPPYGAYNARVKSIARQYGYRICTWTVDTRDWAGRSAAQIRAAARSGARPGGVILMHLFTKSYEALPGIVSSIRAKGLRLCRLPSHPATAMVPYPLPC
jgi:peptidoglycan/xylan/chitin deacetylase (PgdA/CDA1 family)